MIFAFLLFLGILAYVFFIKYDEMKDKEAGAALSAATTEEEYTAVIEKYGDRTAAGTAALAIADLRTTDKDAIEALQYFISTYKDHPNIPKAELQLALRQINSGATGDATTTLDSLISRDPNGYLVPMAKISLGDIAAKDNDNETAKKLYTEAKEINPQTNAFADIAATRLVFLTAKLPQLVEAPVVAPKKEATPGLPNDLPFGPNGVNEKNMPTPLPIEGAPADPPAPQDPAVVDPTPAPVDPAAPQDPAVVDPNPAPVEPAPTEQP